MVMEKLLLMTWKISVLSIFVQVSYNNNQFIDHQELKFLKTLKCLKFKRNKNQKKHEKAKRAKNTFKRDKTKKLTANVSNKLDIARRIFKEFDTDGSGFLEGDEIKSLVKRTYADMGMMNYIPTDDDVKSWLEMADENDDN